MTIQIIFFGTGSGRPMPRRNVAGLAVVRDGETFIFDCGEYTQVQMMKTPVRPGNICGIFLTHFHGDHVNGLPGFLGSLSLNRREMPLPVYGPEGLNQWMEVLDKLGISRVDKFASFNEISAFPEKVYSGVGYDIFAAPLQHRILCFGYALVEHERPGRFQIEKARELKIPSGPLFGKLQRGESVTLEDGRIVNSEDVLGPSRPGLKIVYATDTRPCDSTIALAEKADLLIHEATYPGGMEKEAHKRGHSTSVDAAYIAKKAGVKKLVLTHFSQRYYSTAPFLEGVREIFPNTVIAEDFSEFEVTHCD